MLMCHVHHKLIDVDQVDQHPEHRLLAMKAALKAASTSSLTLLKTAPPTSFVSRLRSAAVTAVIL